MKTLRDRFEEKVSPEPTSGCMLWTGAENGQGTGYGSIRVNGKTQRVHRIAWELYRGPIPEGSHVCHVVCDTPACVNPDHLALCDHRANMADMAKKRRHGASKLDCEKVQEIRTGSEGLQALARKFGVARSVLHNARVGRTWTHCPGTQVPA